MARSKTGRAALFNLLSDVAIELRTSDTLTGVFRNVIARVCDYNKWVFGHVYQRAADKNDDWLPTGIWHPTGRHAYRALKARTLERRLKYDEGLIGRAAQLKSPLWIDDVKQDSLHAHRLEADPRIQAAYFLPVTVNGVVEVVLEFFSDDSLPLESDFVEATRTIELLLGNIIRRRSLEKRVARAAEIERERINAELHDVVGQQVTGIELLARTVQRNVDRGGPLEPSHIDELIGAIGNLRDQIRQLAQETSATSVPSDELIGHLERLAEQHQRAYGVRCEFRTDDFPIRITDAAATHLYRITREAVHNAVVHGQPNKISIHLQLDADEDLLVLEVTDDGAGMAATANSEHLAGIGIDIMNYRSNLLEGDLTIESEAGVGTKLICHVPATRHLSTGDDE